VPVFYHVPDVEVEDVYGQFGCFAVDNIYNVYGLSDRTYLMGAHFTKLAITLHMNPAVDNMFARTKISPIQIPRTLVSPNASPLSHAAYLCCPNTPPYSFSCPEENDH
jgi:hypothetical protein